MPENPLSTDEAKIVNQTARTLRILISNAQLYSPKSQLVKDGVAGLIKTLEPYLSTRGKMNLSESEKNLIVDGQVLKTADKSGVAFVENMIQCELRSITFKNGIAEEELLVLVENMSIKKKEARPDIAKLLSEKGFTHIETNQKVYVALNDNQEIRQEEDPKASQVSNEAGVIEGVPSGTAGGGSGVSSGNYAGADEAINNVPAKSAVDSITSQAEQAVSGQKKDLIKKERRNELQKMLKELDGINRPDLAGQVVDKIAENLDDNESNVRLETVRSFKQLNPSIQQLSDKKIISNLEDKFLNTEESETEEDVYRELADLLESAANRNAAEGNYEKAIQITRMFRLHKYSKNEGFESRALSADKVLKKLANSGLVDILVADLRSEEGKKKEEAYKVVASLDEYAVFYLINTLKDIEDLHLRRIIGFLIKNLGENAVKLLCESITPDISTEEALRILEVMDSVEFYDVVFDELKAMYSHYNPDIRKGVLDILAKIKPDRVKELLSTALDDFDPKILKEAIKLSGRVRANELVPKLLTFISPESVFSKKKQDPSLEEEVCASLGKIKDLSAIEPLAKIVAGGGLLSFTRGKLLNTRIAALYALASYSQTETKAVLSRFVTNSEKNISRAAKEALKMQEKTGSRKGAAESYRLL
ncbi:MAG: hypothetical protein A2231_06630 [Candidatus Firestonebacteria bacterium RIFOXYA2_FULL_40_8]|nr:MAG: hypothetical protein A2231_06630 [Candidatus Firestonebacteria bacterium RIFOXYA2_FULL_40_8]